MNDVPPETNEEHAARIAEAWSNFEYFNGLGSRANVKLRPWEALVRYVSESTGWILV